MSETGVSDHQCLHCDSVFLHKVGNTGVRINHNFVGKPHLAALVTLLGFDKTFAKGPMGVTNGHTYARISIHHLLSGDDFNLIWVSAELIQCCYPFNFLEVVLQ